MAAPTAPTLTSITTEGLRKAGYASPSASQLTQAQDEWMAEIKNDILVYGGGRKLTSMYTTSYSVTVQGKERYSRPTDFFSDMTMEILDGTERGTATGGAVGSVTLAEDEGDIIGKYVLITAGTGANSFSQITAFNSSTFVATVNPDFSVAPASGSSYMVIDSIYQLQQHPIWSKGSNYTRGLPQAFYPIGDNDYGEFILSPTPYNSDGHVFGVRMRYYANLFTLDLAGTLMSTLYHNWRNIWTQGVFVKSLQMDNDNRYKDELKAYYAMIKILVARETYGMDISNLKCKVSDY
mgnify:CR=1 FL=1